MCAFTENRMNFLAPPSHQDFFHTLRELSASIINETYWEDGLESEMCEKSKNFTAHSRRCTVVSALGHRNVKQPTIQLQGLWKSPSLVQKCQCDWTLLTTAAVVELVRDFWSASREEDAEQGHLKRFGSVWRFATTSSGASSWWSSWHSLCFFIRREVHNVLNAHRELQKAGVQGEQLSPETIESSETLANIVATLIDSPPKSYAFVVCYQSSLWLQRDQVAASILWTSRQGSWCAIVHLWRCAQFLGLRCFLLATCAPSVWRSPNNASVSRKFLKSHFVRILISWEPFSTSSSLKCQGTLVKCSPRPESYSCLAQAFEQLSSKVTLFQLHLHGALDFAGFFLRPHCQSCGRHARRSSSSSVFLKFDCAMRLSSSLEPRRYSSWVCRQDQRTLGWDRIHLELDLLRLSTKLGWSVRRAKPKRLVHRRTPCARGSERVLQKILNSAASTTILSDRTSVFLTQALSLSANGFSQEVRRTGDLPIARFQRHTRPTRCVWSQSKLFSSLVWVGSSHFQSSLFEVACVLASRAPDCLWLVWSLFLWCLVVIVFYHIFVFVDPEPFWLLKVDPVCCKKPRRRKPLKVCLNQDDYILDCQTTLKISEWNQRWACMMKSRQKLLHWPGDLPTYCCGQHGGRDRKMAGHTVCGGRLVTRLHLLFGGVRSVTTVLKVVEEKHVWLQKIEDD